MSRWEDYSDSKSRLENWISEMEEALRETPDTKAELGEMKTLIERYKVRIRTLPVTLFYRSVMTGFANCHDNIKVDRFCYHLFS
jgi:hypothetical protein